MKPIIHNVELVSLSPARIRVTGERFEDANVVFRIGSTDFVSAAAQSDTEAIVAIPAGVIVGVSDILLMHAEYGESNRARLNASGNLGVVAQTGRGITIFSTTTNDNAVIRQYDLAGGFDTIFTPDLTRVYGSAYNKIAVIDTITFDQVDINPETPEVDYITPQGNGFIHQVTMDPLGHFLFAAGPAETVWVIDIRPNSPTFHQVLRHIDLPRERISISGIAVNADGTRLLVGTGTDIQQGYLTVFQLDPQNEPTAEEPAPAGWGELLYDTALNGIPMAIAATTDPHYATFTYRYRVASFSPWGGNNGPIPRNLSTLGTITLGDGAPQIGSVTTKVEGGNLNSLVNNYYSGYYTNILTPRNVTVMPDLSYAFIADWELFLVYGYGGQRGDKVGVVNDPFGLHGDPTYLGSTTPIDWGLTTSVALNGDGSRLFASYAGVNEVLRMDTASMIATAESFTPREAERTPIDIANPGIHIGGLTVKGLLQGMSTQASANVLLQEPLQPVPAEDGLQPDITFRWDVDRTSLGDVEITNTLYVSVLSDGECLFPDDKIIVGSDDCHPHRILTHELPAESADSFEYTLPGDIKLTPGQTYYWGVIASGGGWTGRASGSFDVDPLDTPSGATYPSVTILTHGFQPAIYFGDDPFQQPQSFLDLGHMIADAGGGGHVLKYDRENGGWEDDDSGARDAAAVEADKPVVLVLDWKKESAHQRLGILRGGCRRVLLCYRAAERRCGGSAVQFATPFYRSQSWHRCQQRDYPAAGNAFPRCD